MPEHLFTVVELLEDSEIGEGWVIVDGGLDGDISALPDTFDHAIAGVIFLNNLLGTWPDA